MVATSAEANSSRAEQEQNAEHLSQDDPLVNQSRSCPVLVPFCFWRLVFSWILIIPPFFKVEQECRFSDLQLSHGCGFSYESSLAKDRHPPLLKRSARKGSTLATHGLGVIQVHPYHVSGQPMKICSLSLEQPKFASSTLTTHF